VWFSLTTWLHIQKQKKLPAAKALMAAFKDKWPCH
jgi:hypothetical protein